MVQSLHHGLVHAGAGADHAIKARHGHHLQDGGDTTPFAADHLRVSAPQLGFARSIGHIAHLVLEPLDLQGVLMPIVQPAGQPEARQPAFGLRQHQKGVTHGG